MKLSTIYLNKAAKIYQVEVADLEKAAKEAKATSWPHVKRLARKMRYTRVGAKPKQLQDLELMTKSKLQETALAAGFEPADLDGKTKAEIVKLLKSK